MDTQQFAHQLGRMEGKLDMICDELPRHDERIRNLEAWRWYLAGAVAVIAAGLGLVGFIFA